VSVTIRSALIFNGVNRVVVRIFVIGSKHDRAECFEWMEPFPNIEESDVLILDLSTLDQDLLDKMSVKQEGKIRGMMPSIFRVLSTGRNAFCIIQPYLVRTPPPGSGHAVVSLPPNNYDWLPRILMLANKSGQSIEGMKEPLLQNYFREVDEWRIEIEGFYEPRHEPLAVIAAPYIEALGISSQKPPNLSLVPVATNKSGGMISAMVKVPGCRGSIYLLPPTTRCTVKEGVDLLIDSLLGEATNANPAWWDSINLPGLEKVNEQIASSAKALEEAASTLEKWREERKALEDYRNVFALDGSGLVDVVQRMLTDMGIMTKPTTPGYPVDLIDKGKMAIEVTGTVDKIESSSAKVLQVATFKERYQKGEKMIVVANTYRRLAPTNRAGTMSFTPQVADYLKAQNVCAMNSSVFFSYWARLKEGKITKDEIQKMFLSTNGILVE
jgi:hypothetical protein